MTTDRIRKGTLAINRVFYDFVENELLPTVNLTSETFWPGVENIFQTLTPRNLTLLDRRDELQQQIDAYLERRAGKPWDHDEYVGFLREIGYLVETGPDFAIDTANVDEEIATIAGPQLVVPVSNARFALNAANARWGSLYDALYGSNVIDSENGKAPGDGYNPKRGAAVINYAAGFLDRALPLQKASHRNVTEYTLDLGEKRARVSVLLDDGSRTEFERAEAFVGYHNEGQSSSLVFRNHGVHVEIIIDPEHPVGRDAAAGVCDIVLESALTTIQDCEDSVAAVDAEDKTHCYRNWFGLMQGSLMAELVKGGKSLTRRFEADRSFTGVDGGGLTLPGRSLMLVRNVGHLMRTDAILDANGEEVFEGILDAIVTVGCALNDVRGRAPVENSRTGSVYIVKPKMHGPDEAAFTDTLMAMVEDLYGLDRNTIKIGVMDEERRTTVNLKECIRAVKSRLVFINTGFLDRTGDEIHTSMLAGPVLPKETIKQQPWLLAYEDWNVDLGIRCGLPGKAQIGKGMFPKTDEMREMVATKTAHPEAGASCAWVPSPTAATLHAMHYHQVDVSERQYQLATRPLASLDAILTPPFGDPAELSAEEIQAELDNNAQGILGYVVRWIDQGIGCSKVPDINGVNLMEDRATLRISSQHIANWLLHGVCDQDQVRATLLRMAAVVDEQNSADPLYERMSDDPDKSIAFKAACDLVFEGRSQPNGYTEPLLHYHRRRKKALASNG